MNNIGNKLKLMRKQNNLTQEQVSKKLNVSRKTVSTWENDKGFPDFQSLMTLSKLYNVELSDLTGDYNVTSEEKTNKKSLNQNFANKFALKIPIFSYFLNIILIFFNLLNLFLIGDAHIIFITPLMVLNTCVYFVFYKDTRYILKENVIKIITISLVIFIMLTLLSLGIAESYRIHINFSNSLGILIHSMIITIGFDILLFFHRF